MKPIIKKFLTFLLVAIVLFIVSSMSVLMLVPAIEKSGSSLLTASLICGGIVAALSFLILLWVVFRYTTPEKYQTFVLQEINLDEAEINQAIDSWLYTKHRMRMEDKATFLENENGSVSCQIMARKD